MKRLISIWVKFRLEEWIAFLFLIPTWIITLRANWYFWALEEKIPRKFYGGIWRLVITMLVMGLYYTFLKKKWGWRYLWWLREVMPFVFCVTIYTNLHDTIHFVNPHDIHHYLVAIDQWMFGIQPCVWAQQFYHPWLTDYFSISYMNYFLISVIVVLWLMVRKRHEEMRMALLGTILCFYFGYFLYILFPAAPPRLVLADQFIRDFSGSWLTITQSKIVNINPSSSRAAFPSLHCAITLISLLYAFRFERLLFWLLLIPGISLALATVYLRHHYVIDILAGFALAGIVFWITPKIDRIWRAFQSQIRSAA